MQWREAVDKLIQQLLQPARKKTLACQKETPDSQEETPASQEETPASQGETPASQDETPGSQEESPANQKKTPARFFGEGNPITQCGVLLLRYKKYVFDHCASITFLAS